MNLTQDKQWYMEQSRWYVVHNEYFSVDNMTDIEIRESILDDLLQESIKYNNFKWMDLFRFLNPLVHRNHPFFKRLKTKEVNRIDRVLNALVHPDIYNLLEIGKDNSIKIKPQKEVMQAAMDYCGCWLEGYNPPEGVEVLCLTPLGISLLEALGEDKVAESLLMDFMANTETTKTLN